MAPGAGSIVTAVSTDTGPCVSVGSFRAGCPRLSPSRSVSPHESRLVRASAVARSPLGGFGAGVTERVSGKPLMTLPMSLVIACGS